jgi:hypothetical protein
MVIKPRAAALMITVWCLNVSNAQAQDDNRPQERDSIPQALRQPQRGEAPRYPRDLVIGSLARGDVPDETLRFADEVLSALTTGNQEAPSLSGLSSFVRDDLFSALEKVNPRKYRIGEGREEADGAYSFLVRFLGREMGIAGELYLRFEIAPLAEADEAGATTGGGVWRLDDLLLEEPRTLGEVEQGPVFNLPPYERLF